MRAPRLVVACLAKNEGDKYWRSCLDAWSEFADRIYVLDDNSTDDTAEIAWSYFKVDCVQRYGENDAWGSEGAARRELWEYVTGETAPGDYILWLDADMVPARDPRDFVSPDVDAYAFTLYDLWGEDDAGRLLYRDDALWCAHYRHRVWMIRRPKHCRAFTWNGRGIHCGHLPADLPIEKAIFLPPSHALLHYAYADERDRVAKAAKYLSLGTVLTRDEKAHAKSIIDENPAVKPLLSEPTWRLERAT